MNRLYEIFKTPSGPSIGKALLNHTIFSPSQTGETVPLMYTNVQTIFRRADVQRSKNEQQSRDSQSFIREFRLKKEKKKTEVNRSMLI
jgi:hypothetical protein